MNLASRQATFAAVPIGRIRRSHIEAWVKTMASADLARGTIKTRYNNARAVFRVAVRDLFIATDPTEGSPASATVSTPWSCRRQSRCGHSSKQPTTSS